MTREGVEGGLIYTSSALLRDEIAAHGKAVMSLDLAPDKTEAQVFEKLSLTPTRFADDGESY